MLQPTSPHRRTTLPIPIDRSGFTGSQQYNASGSTFRCTFLYHSSAAFLAAANSCWRKLVLSSLPTEVSASRLERTPQRAFTGIASFRMHFLPAKAGAPSDMLTKAGAPSKRFPVPTLLFAFSPAEDRALAAENLIFSCFVRKNG